MPDRPYIRGCGIVSALGSAMDLLADNILRPAAPSSVTIGDRVFPYYRIPDEEAEPGADRFYRLIDKAVDTAVADGGLTQAECRNMGIFIGTSSMDISVWEERFRQERRVNEQATPSLQSNCGTIAAHVAHRVGSGGYQLVVNTACTSSANALIYAAEMVCQGLIAKALVVGVECVNGVTLRGFNSLMLLSEDRCRPFDEGRNGVVLGEAVGAVILGGEAPKDGFYYRGGAMRCDPASVTASTPEGIAAVMRLALQQAGVAPEGVTAIKAHGTSTRANDLAEAKGMELLFGSKVPPFTSIKPHIGYTLGAGGIVELLTMLACLRRGFIPPTAYFDHPDPEIGLAPLISDTPFSHGNIMLNYFGFGGNNSSIIISNDP